MFAAAFAVAADPAAPPPVAPPPHAATTKAAASATAQSFRMFILPPACRGTARLCARSRQALRALPPVKDRPARRDPPHRSMAAIRADDPELAAPGEERAQRAGRGEIDASERRRGRSPAQQEQRAAVAGDVCPLTGGQRRVKAHM